MAEEEKRMKELQQAQQPQAFVLQQPNGEKIYFDIQHSTDTTAIWSFVIAMMIAFILGISATIIAIWYGRKSFQLTEMSFKTVAKQIKASQLSALDLNNKMFEQQKKLQKAQQDFEVKVIEVNYIRELCEQYMIQMQSFNGAFSDYLYQNGHLSIEERYSEQTIKGQLLAVKKLYDQTVNTYLRIDLSLNFDKEIMTYFDKLVALAKENMNLCFSDQISNSPEQSIIIYQDKQKEFTKILTLTRQELRKYLHKKAA